MNWKMTKILYFSPPAMRMSTQSQIFGLRRTYVHRKHENPITLVEEWKARGSNNDLTEREKRENSQSGDRMVDDSRSEI